MSCKVEVRLFPSARKPDNHFEKQCTDNLKFTVNQLDATFFQYIEQALNQMRSLGYFLKPANHVISAHLYRKTLQKGANTFSRRKGINAPFIIMRDFPSYRRPQPLPYAEPINMFLASLFSHISTRTDRPM